MRNRPYCLLASCLSLWSFLRPLCVCLMQRGMLLLAKSSTFAAVSSPARAAESLLKSRPVYCRFMFFRRGPILESSAMLEKAAAALARERERFDLRDERSESQDGLLVVGECGVRWSLAASEASRKMDCGFMKVE